MNKLILLDIFSYSCMNCLRSLHCIKKIGDRYKKYGLDTILIHTPEWEFEKNDKYIVVALKKHKIDFPIIIDKNKIIIKKLKISFWPAQILIRNNMVIYKHVGESNYKKLENNIIKSLKINANRIFKKEPSYSKFPAIYLGKRKNGKISDLKKKLKSGIAYTEGGWRQNKEFIKSIEKENSLTLLTKGKVASFVAASLSKKPIKTDIKVNNKFIKKISINKPQLYKIIRLSNNKQNKLTLTTKQNLAIYSFSFQ